MNTILIVDDSRTFQRIFEEILTPKFQIVGKGMCGNEGFELYKRTIPDLVLIDITMPNCDGKECLKKILSFDPDAKVIMVSGISDERTVDACLMLGALGFVNKAEIKKCDLEISLLEQTILKFIGTNQKRQAI